MSDREKRLIDANELKDSFGFLRKMWSATEICGIIDAMPTADVTLQTWIPVSERLPEEWKSVLVWVCGCFSETAIYLGSSGNWRVTGNYEILEKDNVTHWMPLPEPPKECE